MTATKLTRLGHLSWSERNRGVGRVCAVWSAKTRHFPSSRRGLCHAPSIGCNLSSNRKRKPKWRRCVAASIAVGPSAILTGSRKRPSDWGWNGRFGPEEGRRNNHRLVTVVCITWNLQIWLTQIPRALALATERLSVLGNHQLPDRLAWKITVPGVMVAGTNLIEQDGQVTWSLARHCCSLNTQIN